MPMSLISFLHSLNRLIQSILILTVVSLYILDLSGFLHDDPSGGWTSSRVRDWYLTELERIPEAKKVWLNTTASSTVGLENSDSDVESLGKTQVDKSVALEATVLENGQMTETAKKEFAESEFYGDDICDKAEQAVNIRRETRYAARERGALLHRLVLYVRDHFVYQDASGFDFESMKKHRQKRHCALQRKKKMEELGDKFDEKKFECKKLSGKELCTKIYEKAKTTNKAFNKALGRGGKASETSSDSDVNDGEGSQSDSHTDRDDHHHSRFTDQFFGFFSGYSGFVVETSIWYMFVSIMLGTVGVVCERFLYRNLQAQRKKELLERQKSEGKKDQ